MDGVKASELRLGDLVDITDEHGNVMPSGYSWTVKGMTDKYIHVGRGVILSNRHPEEIRGIVITEAWCQKLLTKTEMQYHFRNSPLGLRHYRFLISLKKQERPKYEQRGRSV